MEQLQHRLPHRAAHGKLRSLSTCTEPDMDTGTAHHGACSLSHALALLFLAQCTASVQSWNVVSYQKLQQVQSKQQVALGCEALYRRERVAQEHVQQLLVPLCRHEAHGITAEMVQTGGKGCAPTRTQSCSRIDEQAPACQHLNDCFDVLRTGSCPQRPNRRLLYVQLPPSAATSSAGRANRLAVSPLNRSNPRYALLPRDGATTSVA
jgi:hypothetical protein